MQTRTLDQTLIAAKPLATAGTAAKLGAATLILIGVVLVYLTGFAHSQALHDAAHDTRHSLAFPCH